MSVGALWDALNSQHRHGPPRAPQSIYDALLYELRTFGIKQLHNPHCLQRLGDLSTDQVRNLVEALIRLQPRFPAITDQLISLMKEQLP
jgi:hypothetical protein